MFGGGPLQALEIRSKICILKVLLRNLRKTECGAKRFLISFVVRGAPFALLGWP